MTDSSQVSFTNAVARLDRALDALDASVRGLSTRMRSLADVETENSKLNAERAQLASDLEAAQARARELDQISAEVARQLGEAINDVRAVIELPN